MHLGEGLLLLLCTPFLLFPTRWPLATAVSLILLATTWLLPLARKEPILPQTPFNLLFLLWGLQLIVANLVTADPDLTLPKATGLILGFALWRYLQLAIQNHTQFQRAVAGYLLGALGLTAVGILNANWLLKLPSQVPGLTFLTTLQNSNLGLNIHPNEIAAAITLYLPLLFSLIIFYPF